MSMSDPISDMLVRIRNAQAVLKPEVSMPCSKIKMAIADTLEEEGYIVSYYTEETGVHKELYITLKYFEERPVISRLRRISKPGLRIYRDSNGLPQVMGGLGISIVSTSHGVMSGHRAQEKRIGGEVLCTVE